MEGFCVRGNTSLLFLLFFGLTVLLAGFMYRAYQAYAADGSPGLGLILVSTIAGFAFSLTIVARILYKDAGTRLSRPRGTPRLESLDRPNRVR